MSFHFPHIHLPVHAVFDIAHDVTEKIDTTVHRVKIADKALKIISGVNAFRHYNWLHNAPRLNVAGNLRGMVVNSSDNLSVWFCPCKCHTSSGH